MKQKIAPKFLSVLLASCFIMGVFCHNVAVANASTTLTAQEQKVVLEQKLKQVENRLKALGEKSRQTQEYLDALEEQLGYLKQQYAIAVEECESVQRQVDATYVAIEKNQQAMADASANATMLEAELDRLKSDFDATYQLYCQRLRALYVSQNHTAWITFLLESGGVANFLIRMQMVESVGERDAVLLGEFDTKADAIVSAKENLENQKNALYQNQQELENNQTKLREQRSQLLEMQDSVHTQQLALEENQAQANDLLRDLHSKSENYGEYRDFTRHELEEIDSDIAFADQKYSVTTNPATTMPTTDGENEPSTNATTPSPSTTQGVQYISLAYPCPSYTQITCGFGEYAGHSGCDFSTKGSENQNIVAAESGTVILVRLLETSYGHYLVIRHDKTTKSGDTVYTLYAHNNDIVVSEGQYVSKGQLIAYSGTTGNSTGPHCHFEVRVGGSSQSCAQDPKKYFKE